MKSYLRKLELSDQCSVECCISLQPLGLFVRRVNFINVYFRSQSECLVVFTVSFSRLFSLELGRTGNHRFSFFLFTLCSDTAGTWSLEQRSSGVLDDLTALPVVARRACAGAQQTLSLSAVSPALTLFPTFVLLSSLQEQPISIIHSLHGERPLSKPLPILDVDTFLFFFFDLTINFVACEPQWGVSRVKRVTFS